VALRGGAVPRYPQKYVDGANLLALNRPVMRKSTMCANMDWRYTIKRALVLQVSTMKVSDVMTRTPVTTSPDASIEDAANLMVRTRVSGLPVVDAKGVVVGMITEGDLLRRVELGTAGREGGWLVSLLAPGRAALDFVHEHGQRVREVMTSDVISTCEDAPLSEVVELMQAQQIKRLPVLRKGDLVGVISRADLLRALALLLSERRVIEISDVELRKRVLAEIEQHPWARRVNVDATVEDGIVELRGAVTDDRERLGLRVIAENTPGVKGVHDTLIWVDPMSGTIIEAPKE
jgi:CBS domain-containing protein